MLTSELRIGARGLLRRRGFTAAAVLTLALGIGANTAVFSIVRAVLLRPLPYPAPDRLVQVWESVPERGQRGVAPANYLDWRERADAFSSMAAFMERRGNMVSAGEVERIAYAQVSSSFFETLGSPMVLGRAFRADDADTGVRAAVLSHGFWRSAFNGAGDVVGRRLTIDDESFEVVGVAGVRHAYPETADLYVRAPYDIPPVGGLGPEIRSMRDAWYMTVVGRLHAGVTFDQAQQSMDAVAAQLEIEHPVTNRDARVLLVPLRDALLGDVRPRVVLLAGVVGLVLLIACANVANLVLLRTLDRGRELAVRVALGASRGRVVRHLVAESAVLGIAGAVAGVALALGLTRVLRAIGTPGGLPLDAGRVDLTVLTFALVLGVGTVVLFGLAPALLASQVRPAGLTGERGALSAGVGGRRMRSGLVVAEVALSVIVITAAALLMRSLAALQAVSPGFEHENLLTTQVSIPGARSLDDGGATRLYADMLDQVRQVPGVGAAAFALSGPLDDGPSASLRIEGRANVEGSLSDQSWQMVTPDYFEAAGVEVVRGRTFDERDAAGTRPVAIINQATARMHWPDADPIGARINTGLDGIGTWVEVVGVVADTRNEGVIAPVAPEMYRPLAQPARYAGEQMMLLVRSPVPSERLIPAVRAAVGAVRADAPVFDERAGTDLLGQHYAEHRAMLFLLLIFAVIAMSLGGVGIYGVAAYAVNQRRRELGVRLALGASPGSLFRLVVGEGLVLVVTGSALGVVGALASVRVLRTMLFGVAPSDPLSLAAGPAMLALVAVAALALPAARAALVDPAEAIR
jgi:putative ABC transport system permease protein